MNWKTWLKGLGAAALGGAATGATQVLSTTGQVDANTGMVALVGAIGTTLAYLLKSPLQLGNKKVGVVIEDAPAPAEPQQPIFELPREK